MLCALFMNISKMIFLNHTEKNSYSETFNLIICIDLSVKSSLKETGTYTSFSFCMFQQAQINVVELITQLSLIT